MPSLRSWKVTLDGCGCGSSLLDPHAPAASAPVATINRRRFIGRRTAPFTQAAFAPLQGSRRQRTPGPEQGGSDWPVASARQSQPVQ